MPDLLADFHTHHLDAPAGATINLPPHVLDAPDSWKPRPGLSYSVGIHPWNVMPGTPINRWLQSLEQLASRPEVTAVGECGLDRLRGDFALQQDVFRKQALLAERFHKPLIIHCVKAQAELLRFHKELHLHVQWTVHGFRGNASAARQLLAAGFDLSFSRHFQPEAVRACPPDRLHIETDDSDIGLAEVAEAITPFLTPPAQE